MDVARTHVENLFEQHHAMRYASSALRDFFGVVHGTPGECRLTTDSPCSARHAAGA